MPASSPRPRRTASRKAPAAAKSATVKRAAAAAPPVAREKHIAQIAYALAEARGFAPGGELEDWLAAEAQFDKAHEGKSLSFGSAA